MLLGLLGQAADVYGRVIQCTAPSAWLLFTEHGVAQSGPVI